MTAYIPHNDSMTSRRGVPFQLWFPSQAARDRLTALTERLNQQRQGPGRELTDSDTVRWLIDQAANAESITQRGSGTEPTTETGSESRPGTTPPVSEVQ